jgi:hypothetical protein
VLISSIIHRLSCLIIVIYATIGTKAFRMRDFKASVALIILSNSIQSSKTAPTSDLVNCTKENGDFKIPGIAGTSKITVKEFLDFVMTQVEMDPFEHVELGITRRYDFDPIYDWTEDACSGVDDTPLGFDFAAACIKHDFGYRNGRHLAWQGYDCFERYIKKAYDDQFELDMWVACSRYNIVREFVCDIVGSLFANAVRLFGKVYT